MKTFIHAFLFGIAATLLAVPAAFCQSANIQVVAKKVTLETRESDAQKFRAGQSRLVEKQVAYEFAIRNAAAVPHEATVSWKIYREGMLGRLAVVDNGSKSGRLEPGKTVNLMSQPVALDEREIRAPRVSGDLEQSLAGYVLTITDKTGKVLLEKFSSKDIQTAHESGTGEPKLERPAASKRGPASGRQRSLPNIRKALRK